MYPISEIFGPTVQGEGPWAGLPTYFVRFAGCDWDCEWCDTKYAVNPKYPGWTKTMMAARDILGALYEKGAKLNVRDKTYQDRVCLSGGNPALFLDDELAAELGQCFQVAMETQGSKGMPYEVLNHISCLVISPKPPSSGMADRNSLDTVVNLLYQRVSTPRLTVYETATTLKYVAFDDADLDWIADFDNKIYFPTVPRYLSAGTPLPPNPALYLVEDEPEEVRLADSRKVVGDSLKWLYERTAKDLRFRNFRVYPQMHVVAWGQKRGV